MQVLQGDEILSKKSMKNINKEKAQPNSDYHQLVKANNFEKISINFNKMNIKIKVISQNNFAFSKTLVWMCLSPVI